MIIDSPIISGSMNSSGSLRQLGNVTITGSLTVTGDIVGNITGSALSASSAVSSSYSLSSSYAATASSADDFTVRGNIVAQTLVVQTITSSVVYSSGSNVFGNSVANTQKFTGSLQVSGSSHSFLGNVGIGVTPSAWSLRPALQTGGDGYIVSSNPNLLLGANVFFNGSNRSYISDGIATDYRQLNGSHIWEIAASGSAGNTISFARPMTLTNEGNLLIGDTTSIGTKLQVQGTTYTAGLSINMTSYSGDVTMNTGTTYLYNGSGGNTFTLQSASGSNQLFMVKNNSGSNLTIARTGSDVIIDNTGASLTTFTLAANKAMFIQQDGGTKNFIMSIY